MIRQLVMCFFMCLITGASVAAVAEPIDQARRLVAVSQGAIIGKQILDARLPQIMSMALSKDPGLSDEKKTRIGIVMREEFDAAIPELLEKTAQIYASNFTEDELQDVIDFHESSTGKKFQKLTPQIIQESLKHGQAWGQAVETRAIKRLRADGDL